MTATWLARLMLAERLMLGAVWCLVALLVVTGALDD